MLESSYNALVKTGTIKDDSAQRQVLAALQSLLDQLEKAAKPRLLKKKITLTPRGLYIWGQVGRGKSMLMALFFDHVPVQKKRRVHFHAFMQEVHSRIHKLRQEGLGDPVEMLAQQIAAETSLLCFDELQATDVADATLLYRLFSSLFAAGVIIVSTSNRPPAELYTGGVQRERFGKFIALIKERMDVLSLDSQEDYRHKQAKSLQRVYFHPLGPGADAFITDTLANLGLAGISPAKATLAVQGRETLFTLYGPATARFNFRELCGSALGPADYLALARRLDTLILTDIPRLPAEKRNEAKRFVTLIDALYEYQVQLICTAEGPPESIYAEGDGAFEFKRTVSRLAEMQSEKYLQEAS